MLILNKNILTIGGNRLEGGPLTPPTPPGPVLPANTVRVRTNDGNVPYKATYDGASYETATLVAGTSDVYDVYKSGTSFSLLLYNSNNVIEVLGANTTGIVDMGEMFSDCTSLTNVALFDTSNVGNMGFMFAFCNHLTTAPLFDTSNVTNMTAMFSGCSALQSVPLFDTSNVTNMNNAFANCTNVQSGALALYQQASSQANPPFHYQTFRDCGSNTTTGAAELAQIPSDWK